MHASPCLRLHERAAERELVEDMVQLLGPIPATVLEEAYGLDATACALYSSLKPKQAVCWTKRFPGIPEDGPCVRHS